MSELKRCPFCGAEARLQKKNRKRGWYVICKNRSCACSTPFYQNTFTSEENLKRVAIEVWNTRKPLKRIVERLEERTEYFKDCTKYGNETEEQEERSYSTMMMYEVADLVDDLIEIVKEEGGMNEE